FDFGPGRVTGGHHKVTATSAYSRKRGFGFASTDGLTETDRGGQDTVRADFVTAADATFLVDLSPGDYAVSVVAGDLEGATDLAITSNEWNGPPPPPASSSSRSMRSRWWANS